jgi:aldose 1-epimerase
MNKGPQFIITEEKEHGYTEVIVKNVCTNESMSILPEFGARLKELHLCMCKNISILKKIDKIHPGNREEIFANAKLSPFANRMKDGRYSFNKINYNLGINYPEENNACHGFIYNKEFKLLKKKITDDSAICTFGYLYENEDPGYPFIYTIDLSYELSSQNGLTCTTKIVNYSCSDIPISDGWHHFYDLGIEINKLKLKIDVQSIIELDSKMIPNGNKSFFNEFNSFKIIEKRHFDSCFKVNDAGGKAVSILHSDEGNINLNIWQETGLNKYNYLLIYTPPDRKSIAIEPMTSNIDSFNNKDGLIVLSPNQALEVKFGICLDTDGISA